MNVPGISDSAAGSPLQAFSLEIDKRVLKLTKQPLILYWSQGTLYEIASLQAEVPYLKPLLEPLSANPMCGMKINKLTLQLHKRKVLVRFSPLYLMVFQSTFLMDMEVVFYCCRLQGCQFNSVINRGLVCNIAMHHTVYDKMIICLLFGCPVKRRFYKTEI